jgi:hypothetical protein
MMAAQQAPPPAAADPQHHDLPLPNPPAPLAEQHVVQPPPIVDFAALQTVIINSRTVDDFVRIYDNTPFQLILRYLFVARGDNDVETWARDWAIRLRPEGPGPPEPQPPPAANDVYLNHCRETVLLLVFTLLDRWRQDGLITNVQLVERFKGHRFTNILLLAVPLDQAQCLYTLQYHHPVGGANHRYGMHWVAEQHVDRSVDWQQLLTQVNGRPTMNHRYLWLLEDEGLAGLELSTNGELVRFLEPYRNHLLEEEDEEEEDEDEEDGAMQEDF